MHTARAAGDSSRVGAMLTHSVRVQLLKPVQAAIMFIQAETDPVEPLHIGNLVAIHKGLVSVPPPLQLDPQQEELLMRPYRAFAHSASHNSNVSGATAEVSC